MNTVKENLDLYTKAVDQGYASAVALGEIQMRSWKSLLDKQMDTFGLLVDAQVKQADLLSKVKGYPEYLTAQAQLGRELTEGLMAKGRETVELAGAARDEYRGWLEQSAKSAGEQLKQAAEAQVKA